jgi:uncharacterized membrane protein YphA (DoxX/SURF4 family)
VGSRWQAQLHSHGWYSEAKSGNPVIDPRRYLSTFAVLSLVLLRLVIGWHFLGEGLQKIEYDPHDGEVRLDFSAAEFLKGAKGPIAEWYHSNAPDGHGWQQLLATPRRNIPPTETEPAHEAWSTKISADWRATLDKGKRLPGITGEQQKRAEDALKARLKQLSDYLAGEADAIAEYRHELWRLENWRDSPEAGEVPFVDQRIATKTVETSSQPAVWVREIEAMDQQYRDDLHRILTAGEGNESQANTARDALADPRASRLAFINVVTTIVTIAVGVCLLLGLFTRLASIVGALFLLGVILSQPPWLSEAAPTMPQVIEFTALLVLAGVGAGRWLGMDGCLHAGFQRFRHRDTPRSST